MKLVLDLIQIESWLCDEYRINGIQIIMVKSLPPAMSLYEWVDWLVVVSRNFQDIVDGFLAVVGKLSNGAYRYM
jgi:hypothetical protein